MSAISEKKIQVLSPDFHRILNTESDFDPACDMILLAAHSASESGELMIWEPNQPGKSRSLFGMSEKHHGSLIGAWKEGF